MKTIKQLEELARKADEHYYYRDMDLSKEEMIDYMAAYLEKSLHFIGEIDDGPITPFDPRQEAEERYNKGDRLAYRRSESIPFSFVAGLFIDDGWNPLRRRDRLSKN